MNYDVIIIGAGPGGIFAAYELMKKKPECKIAVFEEGYPLEKRKCPIDGDKIKSCINCKRCSIMCGFGGAGAFSDGKYNITNDFGGTLFEYIGKKQAVELMKYVDEINMENGGEGTKLYSTAGTKFKKLCLQNKLNLLDASVRHLGTDINYVVLQNLYNQMKDQLSGDVAGNLQLEIDKEEVKRILLVGFEDGTKEFSDDGSTITSTASDGRTLTKTFSDGFLTMTNVLKSAAGAEVARAVKTFDSDGKLISTVVTYS